MTHQSLLARPLRSWPMLVCATLLLAACAQKGPAMTTTETSAAPPPPPAAPYRSSASSLSGYKTDVANRLYQVNGDRIFTGKPPPLLRSIVVVNVVVDEGGNLVSSKIFRDNGDVEARSMALASLQRGMPLPRPTPAVLKRGRVEYLESWLFRNDGKFQIRTLAELQASE